jgi:hypothetical protein
VSSRFLAFAAKPQQVWSVYGCNDRVLLDLLSKRYRKRLNELSASFRATSSKAPDASALLAGFIAGTPPHNAWVAFNIDIILLLLEYFGEQLGSNVLDRVTPERLQEIQDAIAETGSRLDLSRLVSSHPPDHIPTHAVYPGAPRQPDGWGFLDRTAIEHLAAELANIALPDAAGEHVRGAIDDLRNWCAGALERTTGLVLFYS